jgi:hypothetical protein
MAWEKMHNPRRILFFIVALILLIFGSFLGYVFTIGNSNFTFWFGNLFVFLIIFSTILLLGLLLLALFTFKSDTQSTK